MLISINKLIPERKIEFDEQNIKELAASIRDHGMLHAITVTPFNDDYTIVAGNKRVEACKLLGLVEIECNVVDGADTEDQRLELSLHENLKRANLPWYDQVDMLKQLHELRQRQKGKSNSRGGPVKAGWSMRDTAAELGIALGLVSQDIQLADAIKANPKLKNIKDKATALKLVKQVAKRTEAETTAQQDITFDTNQCYLGSAAGILEQFPARMFDVCITDPPWIEYVDKNLTRDEETLKVFPEIFRVLKYDSFLYMFVSLPDFNYYRGELAKIGFEVSDMPLIWHKTNHISRGVKQWDYNRDYEFILLAVKGKPILAMKNQPSRIFECPIVPPAKLVHPNEKPVELIEKLLLQCTFDGSLVLDPFAGSFVIPVTCRSLGRRYIAIERDRKYFELGMKRFGGK